MMVEITCRETRIVNCTSDAAGIEKLPQLDLWESDKFDKFGWEDAYYGSSDAGVVRLLGCLRRCLGQIGRGDHVPVVWRKGADVQAELGVSADGYWGPLKRAVEAGLLVKVDIHGRPGRQKMLVAKMPAESEFHAIARAKGAVERYLQRHPAVPRWVLRSLRVELDNRVTAITAEMRPSRCAVGTRCCEPLEGRGSSSEVQRSKLCLPEVPTYREQETQGNLSGGGARGSYDNDEPKQTTLPSPPPRDEDFEGMTPNTGANASQEVDKNTHDALRAFLSDWFDKYGLDVSAETMKLVASRYGSAVGDSEAVRDALIAKIVRLAESKFTAPQIVGFLLEDCPRRREPEQNEPSSLPAKTTGEAPSGPAIVEFEEIEEFEPVRRELKEAVSSHNYQSWLAEQKLVCIELLAQRAVFVAGDAFLKAWIEENYISLLKAKLRKLWGEEIEVEIACPQEIVVDAQGGRIAAYDAKL